MASICLGLNVLTNAESTDAIIVCIIALPSGSVLTGT